MGGPSLVIGERRYEQVGKKGPEGYGWGALESEPGFAQGPQRQCRSHPKATEMGQCFPSLSSLPEPPAQGDRAGVGDGNWDGVKGHAGVSGSMKREMKGWGRRH